MNGVAVLRRPRVAWSVWAAFAALWLVLHFVNHPTMLDLAVYRAEGTAMRDGLPLYGDIHAPFHLHGTYPPFAALVFVALTVVPLAVCYALVGVANLLLIVAAVALTRRMLGTHRLPAEFVPLLAAALIWVEPVYLTLHFGQINLLLLVLVLWDVAQPATSRRRGIGIGLAAAIKVTPALFIVYLVLTRRFRFAATAAITAAAATLLSLAVRPGETVRFWTHLIFETSRVGNVANPDNQSVRGVLVRAVGRFDLGVAAAAVTAVVLVAGLACSVVAYRRAGEPLGLCAAGVTSLLVSPISWSHHWVWCVPIAVIVAAALVARSRAAWFAAAGYALTFATYTFWSYASNRQQNLHMSVGGQLLSVPYVAFGLAFLAVVAVIATQRSASDRGAPSGAADRPAPVEPAAQYGPSTGSCGWT